MAQIFTYGRDFPKKNMLDRYNKLPWPENRLEGSWKVKYISFVLRVQYDLPVTIIENDDVSGGEINTEAAGTGR